MFGIILGRLSSINNEKNIQIVPSAARNDALQHPACQRGGLYFFRF